MPEKKSTIRRYDIDWLRVLAMFTVFFFHSLRFFTLEHWHVKNPTTYLTVENLANYLETWMMPLIFIVSGASVFFEMHKNKPAGKFIQAKTMRLLVPLTVGTLTHSILQVYLERITHGEFNGSFWSFLPHYFDGLYRLGGNFAWMGLHLWYLEVLFIFSILFLPFILWLRGAKGKRMLNKLGDRLAAPGAIYLLPLVAILSWKLFDPNSLLGKDIFGWPLVHYFSFYLVGYLLVSNENLTESIRRQRWYSIAGALAASALYVFTHEHRDLLVWFMILAFLGVARQYLSFSSPFLDYANQAILPFYILHQPVLVVVGFFVVQWQIPDLLKYFVIAIPAFMLTAAIYEYLVRRHNLLRLLFGMKVQKRSPQLEIVIPNGHIDF